MLTMTNANNIRDMFFYEGSNITEIAKDSGYDRKTIRKYINRDDWNEQNEVSLVKPSILDPYKSEIDQWIQDDKDMRAKQRHTAWRVYTRLKEENEEFDVSYRTVTNYVREVKKQVFGDQKGFLPLQHKAGEGQVDFGHADFIENGTRKSGTYLNVSFPYSNSGYLQLYRGESFECLGEGLKAIFEHIGGVSSRLWFDNASVMVSKVLREGERDLTDSFIRFKSHYQFQHVFCSKGKGNEKGSVEAKVGYHRRNLLVPIPQFDDIEEYNKDLLKRADRDQDRIHYKKKILISKLFEKDLESLLPLPSVPLDVCTYKTSRVDAYGKITLNNGNHTYSTIPRLAGSHITVCLRAHDVTALDENMREVVRHKRFYGKSKQESMDWIPYLEQISRRPAALKYTGIYGLLPDPVKLWLDGLKRSECGEALKVLSRMTNESNFDKAVDAFDKSLKMGALDLDSVLAIFNRYNSVFPDMETIPLSSDIPTLKPIQTDSSVYDQMLRPVGCEQ